MTVICMECRAGMAILASNSVDAIVTDPPYGLSKPPDMTEVLRHWLAGDDYVHGGSGFMGKSWDSFVPGPAVWKEAIRCLKPGGWAVVFAGSRTQDLMALSLRLAGFEIMDTGMWIYGSGFPKSLDISKAIDKHGGASVGWFGPWLKAWRGRCGVSQRQIAELFPSKTGGLTGCVANWELGLNIPTAEQFSAICEAFNLPFESIESAEREVIGQRSTGIGTGKGTTAIMGDGNMDITAPATDAAKRWQGWGTALKPAYEPFILCRKPLDGTYANNVLTHGCGALNIDGCRVPFADEQDEVYGKYTKDLENYDPTGRWPANIITTDLDEPWAKYFYCAKAGKRDRDEGLEHLVLAGSAELVNRKAGSVGINSAAAGAGRTSGRRNIHPTVKPTDLMAYLCKLVTPPGGLVLDPFSGSGSTGKAAALEGFQFIGFEMDEKYAEIANARIEWAKRQPK